MDEREWISKFAQDEEEIILGKRALDLARKAEKSWFSCTDFLSPSQLAFCRILLGSLKIEFISDGGYDEAQRQILLFGEGAFFRDDEGPIAALNLKCPLPVGHRDVLGSVLGLGVRREKVGDILIGEDSHVLLVHRDILPYLTVNLEKIGNTSVHISEIPLSSIAPPEQKFDSISISVASLRLDAVLAAAFHLSREEAQQQIRRGMAQINYRVSDSPSKIIEAGSIVSLRGFGKFQLSVIVGETRKGKIRIEIKKYT